MAYEETEIGTLVKTDPARAAEQLVKLFEKAGGNSVHAALLAGVHHSTLKRWVSKLEKHKVRKKIVSVRETSEPVKMSDTRREQLSATALERRRVAGLQRAYDRLDAAGLQALADETGVGLRTLQNWRDAPTTAGPTKVGALVEGALTRQQARYRGILRTANREKRARA